MKEHDHIKLMALTLFNNQFNRNLRVTDFDMICIAKKADYPIAFEIYTARSDDFFRLRIYLKIDKADDLLPFKLEVNAPYHNATSEDEVWVTLGTLDVYHLESGYLKEQFLYDCPDQILNLILAEDGTPILGENGEYLLTE
jgi:hypothetical protein